MLLKRFEKRLFQTWHKKNGSRYKSAMMYIVKYSLLRPIFAIYLKAKEIRIEKRKKLINCNIKILVNNMFVSYPFLVWIIRLFSLNWNRNEEMCRITVYVIWSILFSIMVFLSAYLKTVFFRYMLSTSSHGRRLFFWILNLVRLSIFQYH